MQKLPITDKKKIAFFCILLLAAVVLGPIPREVIHIHNIHSIIYMIIIVGWGMSVRLRIIQADIRKLLCISAGFMLGLFMLRICRFSYFSDIDFFSVHLWYAYYIPMTAVPALSFLAAIRIGESASGDKRDEINKLTIIVITLEIIISIAIMTNSIHQQMFILHDAQGDKYDRSWLYIVVFAWMLITGLAAFITIIEKCRISSVRKKWYIPVGFITLGLVLLVIYLICGGAPKIFDIKIYHLQEAFCFMFITGFESMIQIGLIPSNSGYGKLMEIIPADAKIQNLQDKTVFRSDYRADDASKTYRSRKEPISGGYIAWKEDITEISRLNKELEDTAHVIEDENELISHENKLRAERIGYETRNRLYDLIAGKTRKQAEEVYEIVTGCRKMIDEDIAENMSDTSEIHDRKPLPDGNKRSRQQELQKVAVLSAYIKRMGNLMLLESENHTIKTGELELAIRESFEYLSLSGKDCFLNQTHEKQIPAELAIISYELFETVIEASWPNFYSIGVTLDSNRGFSFKMEIDTEDEPLKFSWKKEKLESLNAKLTTELEDGTFTAVISVGDL